MAEQKGLDNNFQFLLSDFNTRLRDIDERNKLVRERVLLLGKNLISSRQDLEDELKQIKKENSDINQRLGRVEKISKDLSREFEKFVKRDEIALIERMLRDFQPLEFMRKKDMLDLIDSKMKEKQIKSSKTTK